MISYLKTVITLSRSKSDESLEFPWQLFLLMYKICNLDFTLQFFTGCYCCDALCVSSFLICFRISSYETIINKTLWIFIDFIDCNLADPQPTLGNCWGGSLTHSMLIMSYFIFDPKATVSRVKRLGGKSRLSAQWGLNCQQFICNLTP